MNISDKRLLVRNRIIARNASVLLLRLVVALQLVFVLFGVFAVFLLFAGYSVFWFVFSISGIVLTTTIYTVMWVKMINRMRLNKDKKFIKMVNI